MQREDGFYNAVIGQGLRQTDAMENYRFGFDRYITMQECDSLYMYNGTCRKIIDTPAKEAFRCGFELKDGNEVLESNDFVQSILEDIKAEGIISQAVSWDRLFGGAAILMLVDDGMDLLEPMEEKRVRSIKKLMLFDPQDITFSKRYDNPALLNFGKPEILTLQNEMGGSFMVHASRCILLNGEVISNRNRAERDGWGGRVLDNIYREMQRYDSSLHFSLTALSKLSQGILKLDGMADMLSRDGGEEMVRRRLQLIDMARSIMNTIAISKEDEYDLKNVTTSGIKDIIEQFQYSLSAVTGIPATILFGRSPSGENSTGDADFEAYYNMVQHIQKSKIKPVLARLLEVMNQATEYKLNLPASYTIEFCPLWNESAKEQAEADNVRQQALEHRANAANTFISIGALDASEVRSQLKEDGCYPIDDSLDALLSQPVQDTEGMTDVGNSEKDSEVS